MLSLLRRVSNQTVLLGSVALTLVLGIVDWLTGPEYAFSIFYLLPIAAATWYINRRAGIFIALLSTGAWISADILSGTEYHSPVAPYWNAGVRSGFFLITLYLLDANRKKLRHTETLAFTDALTGAANRRYFLEIAQRDLATARRQATPITMAYIDIDDFKLVNDRQGHAEGDSLLCLVVATMQQHFRQNDVVARLGGDEFALYLPGMAPDVAARAVTRLQSTLLEATEKRGYPVTFSIGIITYLVTPPSVQMMLDEADKLMYRVKASGKNNFQHHVVAA